jgi:hypothetical protein
MDAVKSIVFWSCVASVVITMVIGFTWARICVARFNEEPAKSETLEELTGISAWQRTDYGEKLGWATMRHD